MEQLGFPVILVVGNYLGSISHTLTVYETLHGRNITIASVIVSESDKPVVSVDEHLETLKNFVKEKIIYLPRIDISENKWENVPDILEAIS